METLFYMPRFTESFNNGPVSGLEPQPARQAPAASPTAVQPQGPRLRAAQQCWTGLRAMVRRLWPSQQGGLASSRFGGRVDPRPGATATTSGGTPRDQSRVAKPTTQDTSEIDRDGEDADFTFEQMLRQSAGTERLAAHATPRTSLPSSPPTSRPQGAPLPDLHQSRKLIAEKLRERAASQSRGSPETPALADRREALLDADVLQVRVADGGPVTCHVRALVFHKHSDCLFAIVQPDGEGAARMKETFEAPTVAAEIQGKLGWLSAPVEKGVQLYAVPQDRLSVAGTQPAT